MRDDLASVCPNGPSGDEFGKATSGDDYDDAPLAVGERPVSPPQTRAANLVASLATVGVEATVDLSPAGVGVMIRDLDGLTAMLDGYDRAEMAASALR